MYRELDIVELAIGPGTVGISECPGANPTWNNRRRSLARDMQRIVALGYTGIVCLLEDEELEQRCPDLMLACEELSLSFVRLPIVDMSAPDDLTSLDALVVDLSSRLARGERILLHCLAGLGRSGLVAACLLRCQEPNYPRALALLRQLRPGFIQSQSQLDFVKDYFAARSAAILQKI